MKTYGGSYVGVSKVYRQVFYLLKYFGKSSNYGELAEGIPSVTSSLFIEDLGRNVFSLKKGPANDHLFLEDSWKVFYLLALIKNLLL